MYHKNFYLEAGAHHYFFVMDRGYATFQLRIFS